MKTNWKAAAVLLAWLFCVDTALGFPTAGKPIRLVVPFPAGGEVFDGTARLLGQRLGESLGVPVVVENRPGAGGLLGNQAVAASPPDGHSLLYTSVTSLTMLPHQLAKRPYDELRDFTPITNVFRGAMLLLAHPSLPAQTVSELVAYVKANPGNVMFASWHHGGLNHIYLEMLNQVSGGGMLHVPYKSGIESQRDLVEGRVHLMLGGSSTQIGWVRSGKLKVLAVASPSRLRRLQEFPTFAEQGFAGYEHTGDVAFFGPAKLPEEIVTRINGELTRILRAPDVVEFFARVAPAVEVDPSSPGELAARLRAQYDYMGPVIRDLGIRVD